MYYFFWKSQKLKNKKFLIFFIGLVLLFLFRLWKIFLLSGKIIFVDYELNNGFAFFPNIFSFENILIIILTIVLLLISFIYFYLSLNFWIVILSFLFFVASLSNLIDRFVYDGQIVDYIKISLFEKDLFFNVEDVLIFFSVLAIIFFKIKKILKRR